VASENLPPTEKAARRKRMLIGFGLFAVSAFMYVSFIVKTAIKGP
jgi:type II secretory pathway component PulM